MKTAAVAVEQVEEIMRVLSISALMCLTRIELTEIARSLSIQLPELPEGSIEREESLATLENIRVVLARPEFRAGRGGVNPPAP